MGYGCGVNSQGRDIGYSVPAICDHPGCEKEIDRGVSYRCQGCGLYFCYEHGAGGQCSQCQSGEPPFQPKPDALVWAAWKLHHESWEDWRKENPDQVAEIKKRISPPDAHKLLQEKGYEDEII